MNTFENMCKKLDKREICNNHVCTRDNEYICARNAVKWYTNGDKNKLLKLKGEVIISDWWIFTSTLLAIFSPVVAIFTLLYTIFSEKMGNNKEAKVLYGFILIIVVFLCFCFIGYKIKKFQCVSKWKGHILVAIEELEKPSKI